jgi:hypothetical protein
MNRSVLVLFVFILSLCFTSTNVYSGNMAEGFNEVDFVMTADAGFDNPQNNYAFSIAKFKGDTYVGTGRNFLYRIFEVLQIAGILPPDYEYSIITAPGGASWSAERAEDMCAEIWRYRKGKWKKVYRSEPMDVSAFGYPSAPPENAYAAKEPGFRSMITFTDKWGENAIYAASGASLVPGRLLLKSTDGDSWEEVKTYVFMESDSRSLAVHNGKLYVAPAGISSTATIWATDDPVTTGDGTNWEKVADFTDKQPGRNVAVTSMASFNGYLYAGTQNDEGGFQVWRSNASIPSHPESGGWTRIIDSGAGDMGSTRALTMAVFKGNLYVGTSMFPLSAESPWILPPKGFELIRVYPDDTWDLLIGDYLAQKPPEGVPTLRIPKSGWPGGFGNFLNVYCWTLHAAHGVLYLGTFDISSFLYVLLQNEVAGNPASAAYLNAMAQAVDSMGYAGDSGLYGPFRSLLGSFNAENPVLIPETAWPGIQSILDRFAGADVWKTRDGILWEPVTLNGFGNPENYGIRTMLHFRSFFMGTANPFGGLEMLQAHPGKSKKKDKH